MIGAMIESIVECKIDRCKVKEFRNGINNSLDTVFVMLIFFFFNEGV